MRLPKLITAVILFSFLSFSATASARFSHSSGPAMDHPRFTQMEKRVAFMRWFVKLSPGEYGELAGKQLNFFERMTFRSTQNKMKRQLRSDATEDSEGVNWGGLALGFVWSIIGVAGAYVFVKDKNFRKC
jgi:hypothetical protein